MRIHNSQIPPHNRAQTTSSHQAAKASHEIPLDKPHDAHAQKASQDTQGLVPREFLLALAHDLRSGAIDAKEANSQFVHMVVNNSINRKLSDNDKEKIIKDIAEFFADDQDFITDLARNLANLA